MDKCINFVVSTNQSYLHRTRRLINSVKKNVKCDYKFHCRLINVSPDEISSFSTDYPEVDIKIDNVDLDTEKNRRTRYNEMYSTESAYCANIRISDVCRLLGEGHKYIFLLDVDSIVRKDISELIDISDNVDMRIWKRFYATKPEYKIAVGVMFIKNSTDILNFFNTAYSSINSMEHLCTWYTEQYTISQLLLNSEVGSNLTVGQMTEKYRDFNFLDDSVIWTAKGSTKDNEKYKLEESLYD
tara:strand:+ start:460 stop:1185 length:726 start_codon:yes stop_codon:yes gene_type:complete